MPEENQTVTLTQSDRDRIIDLLTSLVGLGILTYMVHPEPFDRVLEKIRAFGYAWQHRVSIWEATQAIRSLPETDE